MNFLSQCLYASAFGICQIDIGTMLVIAVPLVIVVLVAVMRGFVFSKPDDPRDPRNDPDSYSRWH